MPHEYRTMRPPDPQLGEQEPRGEDYLPTASNWSLTMVGFLSLAAIAILVILAILPAAAGTLDAAKVTVATEQKLLRITKPGMDYRPLPEIVSIGHRNPYAATSVRRARKSAVLPIHGDSALDADEFFGARLRHTPDQPATRKLDEADGAAPCPAGECLALVAITSGICDRTHAVQQAILARIRSAVRPPYSGDCRGVTDAWLIKLKSIQLVAPHSRVESLKPGDFAGLSSVRQMYISHQSELSELPAGVFEGLAGLEELWVHQNKAITALPAGAFRGLPRLRVLSLNGNGLANLEPGAFEGLHSLESLILQNNRLADFPFDEFEALPALTHLYLSENPGYRWGIDASETSLELAPGKTATYWLRLTARPCIGGAEVVPRWRTLGWGVEVGTPEVAFKQNNWFRSQPITIAASADAGSQARVLVHEMQSWCYRQQMDDPPPTVMVSVSSRWQLRLAALPWAQGLRPVSENTEPAVSFAVNTDNREPRLMVAAHPAAPAGEANAVKDHGQGASTLTLVHGDSAMTGPGVTGRGMANARAEMYRIPHSGAYPESPDTVPLSGSIGANDPRQGAQFVGYGRRAASRATGVLLHHL